MNPIPQHGIRGAEAIREAAVGSYQWIHQLIENQLRTAMKLAGEADVWPYVLALFPDSVVVQQKTKLFSYPYKVTGDKSVELGEPTEVLETYRPVKTELKEALQGAFIEALPAAEGGAGGTRWRIRVIRAGLSGNNNYYPDAVLREAVTLFDGARVFVKGDEEHIAGKGKDFRNLIGRLVEPSFVEGKSPDSGEIQATLELLESAGVADKLREAWERKMANIFGFSIDAVASARKGKIGGRQASVATAFREVKSVDLIVEPGAGGQLINLIEARETGASGKAKLMDREEIIALIEGKRPDLLKGKKAAELSDDELAALLREAVAAPAPANDGGAAGAGGSQGGATVTIDDVDRRVRIAEARAYARATIAASPLPDAARKRLADEFAARAEFTEAQVDDAIKAEREYVAQFTESGRVTGLGEFSRIEPGESRGEKTRQMLDAFFDPAHKDHAMVRSFKECYVAITGDTRVTGSLKHCDQALMREALDSTSWADALGDSITRRMVADYRDMGQYDVWRRIATTTPVNDFRTNERTRIGGYGDLPAVAQSGPYTALTSPGDEKASYAVTKRGGTETITLEMIKNDDVGAIRRIPIKLSRAAKRTLAKFVLDFIRSNPTIFDSKALFHVDHGNLGAAALDATTLAAGRLAMLKQTELGSADRIGIGPKSLLVPPDLEAAAVDLFNRNTNNDKTFVQSLSLDVLPIWYWTDANDWALAADPMDIPTIEVGFLDGNEEPELFVQDLPNVGSMFTNDQLTYKIRHIYGGNVLDYRGLYKAVVT